MDDFVPCLVSPIKVGFSLVHLFYPRVDDLKHCTILLKNLQLYFIRIFLVFQTHIYCVVRKLPDISVKDRLLETLKKYGILCPSGGEPTKEQEELAEKFHKTVTVIKGTYGM